MKVTFINNRIRTQSGVFYAHMLPLMQRCAASGHTVNFINFHPGTLTHEVKKTVNGWALHWNLKNLLPVAQHLKKSDMVYCRNYACAIIALILRWAIRGKYRVHADLRGVVPEEVLRYKQSPFKVLFVLLAKFAEKLILLESDSVSCVSHPFQDYLLMKGGKPEKITVVPNGVDVCRYTLDPKLRDKMRKELGLDDQLVYVFSGSPSPWSRLNDMLYLYKKIQAAHEDTRLLIITGKTIVFEKLCEEAGIKDVLLCNLKSPEVPPYLMAGDYAFLMRGNDIAIRVQAPIKFAEYLAAGNKIIITPSIGDCSQLVEKYKAGVIVDLSNLDHMVSQIIKAVPLHEKKRISELASRYLDREKILSTFLRSIGL